MHRSLGLSRASGAARRAPWFLIGSKRLRSKREGTSFYNENAAERRSFSSLASGWTQPLAEVLPLPFNAWDGIPRQDTLSWIGMSWIRVSPCVCIYEAKRDLRNVVLISSVVLNDLKSLYLVAGSACLRACKTGRRSLLLHCAVCAPALWTGLSRDAPGWQRSV